MQKQWFAFDVLSTGMYFCERGYQTEVIPSQREREREAEKDRYI